MQTLKMTSLAIALLATIFSEARAQTETPGLIPGLPGAETLGLPAEEKRVFKLALEFAKRAEPEIEYRIRGFKVHARDAETGAVTVRVVGEPARGSKLRSATFGFEVLVHPDGKVSRPWWSLRAAW
ncbi:MAG: hypothetical protein ACO1QR_11830 [Chthoniobacteraceae bacterium]